MTLGRARKVNLGLSHFVIIVILVFSTFPFYWTLVCTLKTSSQLYTRTPNFFPWPLTLRNLAYAFANPKFLIPFRNSVLMGILTAIIVVVLASLGGYSLARYKYRGKRLFMFLLVFAYLLPVAMLIVPLFYTYSKLHLVNTYGGLIFSYMTLATPFCILLLRNFFLDFPNDLEEAALVDGCNRMGAFARIILPLLAPGVVAVALFTFIIIWNDLLFSMVMTKDTDHMTAAVQISQMLSSQYARQDYGLILGEGAIVTVPIVLVFIFLQKYLVQGMTAGAVKG